MAAARRAFTVPAGFDTARCSGCRARIWFAPLLDKWGDKSTNPRTHRQRQMPMEPGPDPAGNVVLVLPPVADVPSVRVMTAGEVVSADRRYRSHWDQCPNAATYRTKGKRS